ncbi:hypothetical protein [Nocardioides taihuensis]|uniref:Uncharacterized protein n=1 Tax=Nocardioides taihuensis TaxID=1835606 RepID=A0ABW0BHT4_9ACTN
MPGYRGWVLANALSFLEGGHYGSDYVSGQSDVQRESRVHLRGAAFGLQVIGARPGKTWSWRVPVAGSLSKVDLATGYRVAHKTWQVWGADGRPRVATATGAPTGDDASRQ